MIKLNVPYYLDKITALFKEELKENLIGVYLHGSLAMECFHPGRSDIDLLIIVRRKLIASEHKRVAQTALLLHDELPNKGGLEFSVLLEDCLKPFVHPTPVEFHYSDYHREKYRSDGNYLCGGYEDRDLASQYAVAYHRGIALYGRPLTEMYEPVDKPFYLDSILYDVEGASTDIVRNPMYFALNLCRVLYFLKEGAIASKKEGGEWGVQALPAEYRELVQTCLSYYTGASDKMELDHSLLLSFADYMLREIKQLS
ncbi:aminoglycoside adenylyltransferase domain-containing protein [Paenibacillus contaminans]|uniref:Spectinomycin 9-adenylyltransferase n=1 Tax=Paenibacillus contaminans TaxID=450362 RepID=A0A329MD26_9BACL|nr:aminoglycoside adenylyltransferase domain-containing protein [Paenibacillus contaminans]RAV17760.1 hypothetical protein DQG23_26955 [Paenibacillus contaminans]